MKTLRERDITEIMFTAFTLSLKALGRVNFVKMMEILKCFGADWRDGKLVTNSI